MDETPVFFFYTIQAKTIDQKEEKFIEVRTTKSKKQCITAVLACTSTGEMLPPMTIFKGTTKCCI